MSLIDNLFEFKRLADANIRVERNPNGTLRFFSPAHQVNLTVREEDVPFLLTRLRGASDCYSFLRNFDLIAPEKVVH